MGQRITVDSSTMANKGLEIMERIRIAIHPKCVVHSLVEFRDGSFLAQMSPISMRNAEPSINLFQLADLKFCELNCL
jgi:1-deoxy-D-xylulose-5-phosphate reductoisomerase